MAPQIRRYSLALFIALMGFAITIVMFEAAREWEKERYQIAFDKLSQDKVSAIRRNIDHEIHNIDALGALFEASEEFTWEKFATFAGKMLSDSPHIQALEWVPRVPDTERAFYEDLARRSGFEGFRFTERGAGGTMVEAARREEYFPVYFVKPYEGNEAALGFDLASDKTRLRALNLARVSGQITATARIPLAQEAGGQFGLLIFRPVYEKYPLPGADEERWDRLQGFALGVFRIGNLVDHSLSYLGVHEIKTYVFDNSAPAGSGFLHLSCPNVGDEEDEGPAPSVAELKTGIYYSATIQVANRQWLVISKPCEPCGHIGSSWHPQAVMAGGFMLSLLSAFYVGTFGDKAEQARKHAKETERQSYHDNLTGLPNRKFLVEKLHASLARLGRDEDYRFSLLYLDLDRFKIINDSLGHAAGDMMLCAVAERITKHMRTVDIVARLGGDEFALLLEDATTKGAAKVAERMQSILARPFVLDGREVFSSVSIGIASSQTHYENPEDILRDADTAMYRAKASGKALFAVFDKAMHDEMVETVALETDLRRAMNKHEMEVHFQPIVSLESGSIVGAEALTRWHHPSRGLISPAKFIPLAEETGHIESMGKWIMKTACRQHRLWRTAGNGNLKVAVNMSVRQFSDESLLRFIEGTLRRNRLSPDRLELEITESMAVESSGRMKKMLHELAERGVRISLDDFGTGFSALDTLKRFPISTIKLDKSFVSDMMHDACAAELARAIISMAGALGLNVVAEGVETKEQMEFLRQAGCREMQGYLFSPAVTAREFFAMLKEGKRLRFDV
jgi:diguanylate cyclase (GGDEF)-like protein